MRSRILHVSRSVVVLCAAFVAAGLIWGLAGAPAADPSVAPSGGKLTLRVGWTTDPDNLNPFAGGEQSSYELFHVSYDFLTDYGDRYLETQPGLAESWTRSDDGLTWTFKIRSGVKWSDGTPLTAHDIAFTYNWQKKLGLLAFASSLDGIDRAEAPDDTTLIVVCERPKADILSMWCPILPEHVYSRFKTYDEASNAAMQPPIVGSGPFRVVEWRKGSFVRCEANPEYWGGKPAVDELIFLTYKNQDTLVQDLKLGTVDLAINIPPAQVGGLKGEDTVKAAACAQKAFEYLAFNCYEGPSLGDPVLRDPKFRAALNWGIDKGKLTKLAHQGYADPGTSLFEADFYDPDLDWHWQPPADAEYTYDPDKARRLLADAGYRDTDGNGILNDPRNDDKDISLRLWARNESPQSQVMGKLITEWWGDLGIDIRYSVEDNGVLIDEIWNYAGDTFKPDFDMVIWQWQPSGSDPGRRLGYFRTSQIENQNNAGWSNEQYDELWERQAQELDPQARKEIVHRMQEIFYEESPYIVLDYPKTLQAWNTSRWEGWQRIPQPNGAVAYISDNISNYFKVSPKGAATSKPAHGARRGFLIGLGASVAIVVGVVVLALRSRPKDEEG